ncbi:MAG TPA: sulfatase-like hydrolase/transferase [Geminicoccaceae bacterium]|nr:sulfatase-like hydrolase/transferase [Geminicoccaceae bacterium]
MAAAVLGTLTVSQAHAAGRNILLLIADDYGIDVTRYYPLADRRTTTPEAPPAPNLANLARNGLLFRNTWAQPSCSPTRATMLTGRYGFRTGIGKPVPHDPGAAAPTFSLDEFTLPEAFQARPDLNYLLLHVGKWHLSRGASDPNQHGWPRFSGPHPELARLESHFQWPKVVNGVETTSTVYATTDQVNDIVQAIAEAKAADRPYFIWGALSAPHSPYQKPPNHLHSRDSLPSSGATRRAYFEATVEAMDTEIGRLLRSVELATTTVIFLGDNGTTGSVIESPYPSSKDKGTLYQGGVHVPLLIAGAGVEEPGRTIPQLVNTTDLFPTILQLAGIDPAAALPAGTKTDGVSLLPYIENKAHPKPRAWAYAEQFPTRWNARWQRTIRDGRYRLIEGADGAREFYDLSTDAFESRNLLRQTLTSTQSQRLRALDQQLDALLATR